MKNTFFSRAIAVLLALICVLSMAFTFVSCSNDGDANDEKEAPASSSQKETSDPDNGEESSTPVSTPTQTPESPDDGKITITLEVIGPDGKSKEFAVATDPANNLRQALEGEGLISGDEGPYGMYVKVVNGITADYDVDGSWWSLTKDGARCSGVDSTKIADGDHFEFTYTK